MKKIILSTMLLLLLACTSNTDGKYTKKTFGIQDTPGFYTVKKGDSLFSIAWRFGLSQSEIQRLNGISNPNKIFVDQKLNLKPKIKNTSVYKPRSKPKPTVAKISHNYKGKGWVWPMKGKIERYYNPNKIGANGIRIEGKPNQIVNAVSSGVVAYKGSGLNGYGNVIIIKHGSGLLTAYGFLSKSYVKEGDKVKKRQKIAIVGYGSNRELMLHFEVRKNGKPTNPSLYIGSKYHF